VILAAARAEFAQYGLAGARIDRIARSARASKERIYAHFGDKEALFREVLAADSAEFFAATNLRQRTVPEFVGDVFDLAHRHPEHLRMITWARLEGFPLDEPRSAGEPVFAETVAAIEAAQTAGEIAASWDPSDLITVLIGVSLAWASSPHPDASANEPAIVKRRRAAAVDAAARIIAPSR